MAGNGDKDKFNDEIAAAICVLLRKGHYRKVVAGLVGITDVTFSQWMHRKREPFLTFQRMVEQAEAEAEDTQLSKILDSPEPADAKWYLSRKFPERWAETRRMDMTAKIEMGAKLNASALTDPSARAHIEGLASWLFANTEPGDTEPDDAGAHGHE